MKILFLLLLAAAAGAMLYVSRTAEPQTFEAPAEPLVRAPAPQVLTTEPGQGEVLREFAVEGMCCQSCTGKLFARVSEVAGVRAAAVSLADQRVQVVCSAELDLEPLLTALNFEPYVVTPLPQGSDAGAH